MFALGVVCTLVAAGVRHYIVVAASDPVLPRVPGVLFLVPNAAGAPRKGVLVVGDSIARMAAPSTLCGLPVTNEGAEGSRVVDWPELAPKLAKLADPKFVVVALGTNDANRSLPFDAREFSNTYRQMIRQIGRPVIAVVPATPLKPNMDQARVTIIQRAVAESGAAVVVPAVRYSTIDGVHPDAGGREEWRSAIERDCPALRRFTG